MRLAFLGTPHAAVPALRALCGAGHDVRVVITRPDRRRARGGSLSPSPVKEAAQNLGLAVHHSLAALEGLELDRGVVVAYGAIIPATLLERVPMLNVHFSLLPRWRGAAPLERAILAGDDETGVSIMTLEPTLDTGPVHLVRRVAIGDKSLSALRDELADLGATSLLEVLASPELLAQPTPQHGEAVYAEKLTGASYALSPSDGVEHLMRVVRLERAYAHVEGRRLRVSRAHVAPAEGEAGTITVVGAVPALVARDGALILDEVQPESARFMSGQSWWAGARLDRHRARWQ